MDKPNCFRCEYRGSVPGSAHSCCKHPAFEKVNEDPMLQLMSIFGSVGRAPPMQAVSEGCKVVGDERGVARGWFNHPFSFDPVWLRSCTGFKPKPETVSQY